MPDALVVLADDTIERILMRRLAAVSLAALLGAGALGVVTPPTALAQISIGVSVGEEPCCISPMISKPWRL